MHPGLRVSHFHNTNHNEAHLTNQGAVLFYITVFLKPNFAEHEVSTMHYNRDMLKPKLENQPNVKKN
jgi:hypothetical protein